MNAADAKQAVKAALTFFEESGIDPDAEDVRIEELVLSEDDSTWEVTLGYLRPRKPGTSASLVAALGRENRIYKTFTVKRAGGEVTGMRIRALANAG